MSLASVFQIGSLGDSIVSVPALRSIPEYLPDCSGYVLVSGFYGSAKVLPSEIFDMAWKPTATITYDGAATGLRRFKAMASLVSQLRHYRPKYAIYLMPSARTAKQAARDRLVFRAAGVQQLIGFRALSDIETGHENCPSVACGEAYLRLQRIWGDRTAEKYQQYTSSLQLHPDLTATKSALTWLGANRRYPDRPLVAVCPYSNLRSKEWPEERYVELLRRLESVAGAEAVLVGGPKDRLSCETLKAKAGGAGMNAAGVFQISESAALLKECALVISVDSGPMHLAAAVGTPVIGIFSRIAKHFCRWIPIATSSTVLYRNVPCAGCDSAVCAVPGHPCMADIPLQEVFSLAEQHLAGRLNRSHLNSGTVQLTV